MHGERWIIKKNLRFTNNSLLCLIIKELNNHLQESNKQNSQ